MTASRSLPEGFTPIRRLSVAYLAFFAAVGAAWPYLPIFYRSLGLSLDQVGLVMALYSGMQFLASPAWGALADRFHGSRATLPAAVLVGMVGAVLLSSARDLPSAIGAVVILAVGLAGVGPVLDARSMELLGADRIRYGQLRGWGSLSFVAVAVAVGLLLDRYGVGALFAVYLPLLLITALVTASLPRVARDRSNPVRPSPIAVLRVPALRTFFLAAFLVWGALNAISSFYSLGLVRLGGNNGDVGLLWSLGAVIEVPIMFAYPQLAARFGATRLLLAGALLFAVRSGLAAVATSPAMLIGISPVEGIGYGLFFTGGVGYVAQRAPAGLTATAQGVYTGVGGLSSIVGALLGGAIAGAFSIPVLFGACAAVGLVGFVALWLSVRGTATEVALPELEIPVPVLEEERLA